MSDLTGFLLARIAEDEAVARGVQDEIRDQHARGVYRPGHGPDPDDTAVEHLDGPMDHPSVIVGPARMLAECEAKRHIVELYREAYGSTGREFPNAYDCAVDYLESALLDLARLYAEHPDFRDEWRTDHE